jgi:hypothetical protein
MWYSPHVRNIVTCHAEKRITNACRNRAGQVRLWLEVVTNWKADYEREAAGPRHTSLCCILPDKAETIINNCLVEHPCYFEVPALQ